MPIVSEIQSKTIGVLLAFLLMSKFVSKGLESFNTVMDSGTVIVPRIVSQQNPKYV
jgi:hypothetical protein